MGDVSLKMTLPFAIIPLSIIVTELSDFPPQDPGSRLQRALGQGEKERDVFPDEEASVFSIRVLQRSLLSGCDRAVGKS